MRAKLLALLAGSAIALTATVPANAAPVAWDNDVNNEFQDEYHLGCEWEDLDLNTYVNDPADANADPTDEVVGGTCIRTYVYDTSLSIQHYERVVDGDFLDAPFCSSGWGISLDAVTATTVETDSHGDKVFVITGTYDGLDVVGELRMYSEQDIIRWHWTFTNNTNSAISGVNVELDNGDSQDNSGNGTTSDGDQLLEVGDWYATMFDVDETIDDGDRSAIATAFIGGNGEIDITSVDSDDVVVGGDQLTLDYDFDVATGESMELIWFLSSSDYTAGADPIAADSVDPLVAGFGDGVIQGRFARGLVDNDNSNWETIIPEAAELAETGADVSSLWAGLGLLVAGVGVVATRRRARA